MGEESDRQMGVAPESSIATEASAKPRSRPKWHRIYYLLAIFDIVTIAIGLYIVAHLVGAYKQSVRVNQEWAGRINAYRRLDELAGAVNAPPNDVFDSHDVETESEKLRAALRLWDEQIALLQDELRDHVAPAEAAPLQEALKPVASAMAEMVDQGNSVFSYLREHRPDLAGQRMAAMDRNYAKLQASIDQSRQRISEIQQRHLREQAAAAGSFGVYEYVIAFAILLMVVGATAYGRMIAKHVESDAREREESLERLATANEAFRKLSSAVEQTADKVVITDREGIIEFVNPAFERMTGYTRDEVVGQTPRVLKSGQHDKRFYEHLWQTILSGEAFRGVLINRRKDGSLFHDEEVITPLRDPHGIITHFVAAGRDITEREQAETELARLHEAAKAHAAQWEALFGMSRLLNQSLQLDEVFEAFAQAVKQYVPYDRLGVIVPQDHTLVVAYAVADPPLNAFPGQSWPMTQQTGIEWILTHRQPRLVQDLAAEARFSDDVYMAQEGVRALVELPLLVGGKAKGVFYLDSRTPAAYSHRDIERLQPLADQVAMVMEHSHLYGSVQGYAAALEREVEERTRAEEQLRTLATRLESVREDERVRIAKEIHEELGQLLLGLKMELSWLHARLPQEPPALRDKSQAMRQSVDETIRWVRRIAGELRPRVLDDLGLVAAIEWQAQEFQARTGIQTHLTVQQPEPAPDWERSTAVFRILQEALSNVARHAHGSRVHINLSADAERLTLEVIDNGKGITQYALTDRRSLGLQYMRERAFGLSGAVTIVGRPGQGTTVTVLMPFFWGGG
ncbi:MAG: PAS domain S-box protein, partial [Candidatus Methylomirabilis oxyfera]|nr:PAS domain S-box protein [Candidatus Methylomirabilis oxyfera]